MEDSDLYTGSSNKSGSKKANVAEEQDPDQSTGPEKEK